MADKQKIRKLIEPAAKNRWWELNLSGNTLWSLPFEIFELTRLTSLNLSGNQLTSLPTAISRLTNLTNFDLSRNNLATLPIEITELTSLTNLDSVTMNRVLIGIFWKRFGTPTADSKTGTEHEFNLAHEA